MASNQRSRRLLGTAGRPGVTGLTTVALLSTVDASGAGSGHRVGTAVGIVVVALCAALVIGVPLAGAVINRHRRRALAAALAEAARRPRHPAHPAWAAPRAAGVPSMASAPPARPGDRPAAWLAGRVAPGWETAPAADYGSSLPVAG